MTADVQERAQQAEAVPVLAVDVYGAARMLGLGRSSVLGLADSGQLPRLRFGRAVRFATADVEALVEQRRQLASREAAGRSAGLYRLTPGDQAK
jgi:excisionase family DNA binding protein